MTRHITLQGSLAFGGIIALLLVRSNTLSPAWSIVFSTLGSLITWIVYRSFIYPFYFSPLRHIPTVPGCPLWGHAPARLSNEVGIPERKWHKKYGRIVRYFLPLGVERLNIADDDAIKEITTRKPYDFVKAPNATRWMSSVMGENGVLLVEGQVHAKQRKALAPAFSTSSIRDLQPHFWAKGTLLADLLAENIRETSSQCVEVLGWLNKATLDVISSGAFDYDVDSLRNPGAPLRRAYSAFFTFDLASIIILGSRLYLDAIKYLPFKTNKRMKSNAQVVTDIASSVVQSKLEANPSFESKGDIISLIVRHNKSLPESEGLSFEDIRDQVKTFLAAGHDTTATGVAWTIDLLSKHQEIQDRLRREMLAALPALADPNTSCDPEALAHENVLDRLPYLNNVCQESLRFIPPIPTVIRKSVADSILGGYVVPAGTYIYITSHAINHLPCYWGEDADRFDPDRWDKLPKGWVPNAYQTFLEGPRGCIGRRFAETEMKVFLCCLLSKFRFEVDESWPDQEKNKMWRLVLKPKDGINVKMSLLGRAES